jgi:hypothetical protein
MRTEYVNLVFPAKGKRSAVDPEKLPTLKGIDELYCTQETFFARNGEIMYVVK